MSKNQSYCSELCKFQEEEENDDLVLNKLLSEKKYDEVVIFFKKLDSEKREELKKKLSDDNLYQIVKSENNIVKNTLNYIQGNYLSNIDRKDIINRYKELNSNENLDESNQSYNNENNSPKKSNNENNSPIFYNGNPLLSFSPNQLNLFGRI